MFRLFDCTSCTLPVCFWVDIDIWVVIDKVIVFSSVISYYNAIWLLVCNCMWAFLLIKMETGYRLDMSNKTFSCFLVYTGSFLYPFKHFLYNQLEFWVNTWKFAFYLDKYLMRLNYIIFKLRNWICMKSLNCFDYNKCRFFFLLSWLVNLLV